MLFLPLQITFAQLTGSKSIPGDYATIQAAIADLNTQGVGAGGVTFNVAAGHTENSTADITITATGTAGNAIIFQKSGVGANPLITRTDAGTQATTAIGALGDAVIRLNGTDYITFDGIDVTATDEGIEYGYFTFKPDGTNGCQFVSILNADVTLNKGARDEVVGICISNGPTTVSSATGVVVTQASGTNSNILVAGCTVDNAATGIYQRGATAMYDDLITIGQSGGGNIIQNFGSPSTSYGTYSIYADNIEIAYNNYSGTGTSILYGIFGSTGTNSDIDIFENTITLINNAASSTTYGINNAIGSTGTDNTVNIYNNIVENFNVTSTGSVYGIYNSASAFTVNMYGNIVRNNSKTIAGAGTLASYWLYSGNTGANGFANVYDNMVYGNTISGGTGDVYCLYSNEVATATKMVYNNSVYDNEGPDDIFGVYTTLGVLAHVYNNNIYDITSTTSLTTSPYVSGIYISSGTSVYIYNNFISDLKAPNSAATDAVRGINVASATASSTRNLYYNTIYLNASSGGTNFGSTGIFSIMSSTATTATLDMRNNNVVNVSTPNGTGLTVAFRRSSATSLANYNTISNNNNFYAGTPGASNLLFSDGTNNFQTIGEVKAHLSPGESASVAGNPPFVNATTAPYNLHIDESTPTQLESSGTPVTTPISVSVDFDNDTRNAATPDIGADEFNGIGADLTPPNITYTLLPNVVFNATSVVLTATITDASGVAGGVNSPRLYIKKTTDVSYVFDNNPGVAGDDYTFTINYTAIGGISVDDTIEYYVAAEDVNANVATNPAGGSGASPPGTTPPSAPNTYLIIDLPLSGTYTVGLTDFINRTGRQVYFETRTRTVTKNMNGSDVVVDLNAVKEDQTESKIEILNPDLSPRNETLTETYKELMENGKPFDRGFYQENTDGIYPTLTEAVNDLNLRGVSGPVTFSLVDSYYGNETYPIRVEQVAGASSTNTITIKPATGITAVIPGDAAQPTSQGSFEFGGADYVIIDGSNTVSGTTKDLHIASQVSSAAIHFFGEANNNVLKNVVLESENISTASGTVVFNNGINDNNLVQNCTIKNSDSVATRPGVGIYFFSSNTSTGTSIIDCEIYNFDDYGIRIQGIPNVNTLVSGCEVYMTDAVSTSTTYGVYVSRAEGLIVEKSKIYNLAGGTVEGIYLFGSSVSGDFIVRNNFVSLANSSNTSGTLYGIDYFAFAANSADIYYNSVYLGGSDVTGTSTTAGLTKRDDATNFLAYNNAVYNARLNGAGTGTHYAIYVSDTINTVFEMDYNDFYVDGAGGVFGFYQGLGDIANLSAWQTSTGLDANSLSANPGYIGNDDLHILPFYTTLDGQGLFFSSVPDDIDGDVRNMTTPDIGADEYTFVPPSVIDPTNVTATPISSTQIDVAFTPNANNDNVVIVFNQTGTFGVPSGPPPAPGNPFAGGTLIANTTASPYMHTGLTGFTQYYYRLWSYDGAAYSFGVAVDATTLFPPITTFPWNDNLENPGAPGIPPGWHQDITDAFDWTFDAGGTPSSGTGPSIDHNPGTSTGTYAFTESSSNTGETANIWTPPFNVSGLTNPVFSFWYHMFGPTMGTLNVDYSTDGGTTWTNAWTLSGDQGDTWYFSEIAIPTNSNRIRFSGTNGTSFTSDMAFDDVTIFDNTSPPNCAVNMSPPDGEDSVSVFSDLNWADGGGVTTGYRIYFGTDNPPTNIENGTDLGNVLTYNPSTILTSGTTYYWQIVPYNINGNSTGCSVRTFTTYPDAPLSGDYTVGLNLFNKVNNRNLVMETRTRKVMVKVPIEEVEVQNTNKNLSDEDNLSHSSVNKNEFNSVEEKISQNKATDNFLNQNEGYETDIAESEPEIKTIVRYEMVEVDEEYTVLTENGEIFMWKSYSEKQSDGFEDGIYPTIAAAVADLTARGVSGPVNFILVDAAYSETYPIVIGEGFGTSSTNLVTFKPQTGLAVTINAAAPTTAMFHLNGSDWIIFDGLNTGGSSLTLTNASTTVPIFFLENGATNNSFKNLTMNAQYTSTTNGVINIRSTTNSTGNSGNSIMNNTFNDNAGSRAANYIYSSGEGAAPNGNNSVTGNHFKNFTSAGVRVTTGSGGGWTISNNHLYNVLSASSALTPISFLPGVVAGNSSNTISGNFIGGSAPGAGGSPLIVTSASTFVGIAVNSDTSAGSTVSNNTIRNINLQNTGSHSFTAINATGGALDISNNSIGDPLTANSILTAGSSTTTGIAVSAANETIPFMVTNNTIANINATGTGTAVRVRGIYQNSVNTNIRIINNTIHDLSTMSSGTGIGAGSQVAVGIHCWDAVYDAPPPFITGNTVYNIKAENTGAFATTATGMFLTDFDGLVDGNTIYNIINLSTGNTQATPPIASGFFIRFSGGTNVIANNMVSIGQNQSGGVAHFGIINVTNGVNNNLAAAFNTIVISGTVTSGGMNTAVFQRGYAVTDTFPTITTLLNNIFDNQRTGGTGKHYAISNITTGIGWNTSDYNLLNSSSSSTIGNWEGVDQTFAGWQAASGHDSLSFSGEVVNYVDIPSADLHLNMGTTATVLESGGFDIAELDYDYDNDVRPGPAGSVNGGATAPDIGADEFDGVPVSQSTFQLTVNVANGWNMVSIPGLHPTNQQVLTWWPGKDPSANVFKYSGGYQSVTDAAPSEGYWMKNLGPQTYNTGDEWPAGGINIVPHNNIPGAQGWNLIGGYEYNAQTSGITTNPPGQVEGSVFGYSGGYQTASEMEPGYGYWIKLTSAAEIILPPPAFKGTSKLTAQIGEDWGKIIITDAAGISYTLYAVNGDSPNGGTSVNLNLYELPPVPPSGIFDVRYSSGRYAEDLNKSQQIDLSGVVYPVKVKAENTGLHIQDATGRLVNERLKPGEEAVISQNINKLNVSKDIIPDKYSLEQNYPNPFNPTTVIEFGIPEDAKNVKLTIYNTLGEKVAELINGSYEAGYYKYQWDAVNYASGLYIYELRTEKFVSIKKMMLLK